MTNDHYNDQWPWSQEKHDPGQKDNCDVRAVSHSCNVLEICLKSFERGVFILWGRTTDPVRQFLRFHSFQRLNVTDPKIQKFSGFFLTIPFFSENSKRNTEKTMSF